ncbi:MAG: diacylglycerol kinase [Gammaproteobacteria bacterium]|nr:diacylglycerol kinase [Gammaproteobacteria bacterium]
MNDGTSNQNKRGFDHLIHATQWSIAGFRATFKHEAAFRQELFLIVLLAPLGWWLGETGTERALLIGSLWIVLIVEMLNTAVESAINRIGTEHHELSGRAKDQGSAAVTLSLLLVGIVWGCVLFS